MMMWSALSASLLIAALASFSWGMRRFFQKPSGDCLGMKVIRMCSSGSALLHLAVIVAVPSVSLWQALLAALMYLSAIAIFFWAIRANGKRFLSAAFSPDEPHHLVTWGPYRFVRHPFYCSYLLTWTAGFVATGCWWLVPSIVLMAVIYHFASQMEEEKFAASSLDGAYRDYRESTGRFIPNPVAWIKARRKDPDAPSLA